MKSFWFGEKERRVPVLYLEKLEGFKLEMENGIKYDEKQE